MPRLKGLPMVTCSNYYSTEIGYHYWSASTIKSFMQCEARAYAEMTGNYTRPSSPALMIGSYVDAWFEGKKSFDSFCAEHKSELFKKDGTLKADYVKANEMIERMQSDPVAMSYMKGRKQTIKVGYLFGQYPFRCKFDVYRPGVRIVDLKTVKDFEPIYKPGVGRVNFIEGWNWDLQLAIYAAVEGHDLDTYINAVSKETPSDLALVEVDRNRRKACLDILESKMPRFDAIRLGVVEPERCGKCAYCRETHKLTRVMTMDELDMEGE